MNQLVALVEEKRERLGLTQRVVAKDHFNWSEAAYSMFANGKRGIRRLTSFSKIATFVGITVEEAKQLYRLEVATEGRQFTGAELRELAIIVDAVGHPLTLETLTKIATEIKTAASP